MSSFTHRHHIYLFNMRNGKKKLASMMAGEPDVVSAREVNRSEPGGAGRHESLQAPASWDPPQG